MHRISTACYAQNTRTVYFAARNKDTSHSSSYIPLYSLYRHTLYQTYLRFTMATSPPSLNHPSSSAAPDAVPEKLLQTPSSALEAIEDIVYGSVSVT